MAERSGKDKCYRASQEILDAMTKRYIDWAKLAEESSALTPVTWHYSEAYDEHEAALIIGRDTGLWDGSDS